MLQKIALHSSCLTGTQDQEVSCTEDLVLNKSCKVALKLFMSAHSSMYLCVCDLRSYYVNPDGCIHRIALLRTSHHYAPTAVI